MKQGRAPTTQSGHKVEPTSRAVNPAGASQIGLVQGSRRAIDNLYEGKGYRAPMMGMKIHPSGSQGKR